MCSASWPQSWELRAALLVPVFQELIRNRGPLRNRKQRIGQTLTCQTRLVVIILNGAWMSPSHTLYRNSKHSLCPSLILHYYYLQNMGWESLNMPFWLICSPTTKTIRPASRFLSFSLLCYEMFMSAFHHVLGEEESWISGRGGKKTFQQRKEASRP